MPMHWGYPRGRARIALPALVVEERAELREALRGLRYKAGGATTAGVGNFAQVQLFNPANSNRIMLLESIVLTASAASRAVIEVSTTAGTTLVGPWVTEDEAHGAGIGQMRTQDGAAIGGTIIADFELLALTPFPLPNVDVILGPGNGVVVRLVTTALTLRTLYQGREWPRDQLIYQRGAA